MRSPFELAALATAAIPGLEVTAVFGPQILEEHLASTRISDAKGNRWTVTVTDEDVLVEQMEERSQLLSFLSSCYASELIPFDVPRLEAYAQAGDRRYAAVFSVTPGSAVSESDLLGEGLLAGSLGRALAAFHNLEPRAFTTLGCQLREVPKIRADLASAISAVGREIPGRLRKRWLTAIEEEVLWNFEPAPTHTSLSLECVLVSHGAVRAITNCELSQVSDPALDLSWLLPLVSDEFLERLVSAYSVARKVPDLHLFTRAQLYSELALLDWLRFGMSQRDSDITAEATQMLAELDRDLDGSVLVERTRPVVELHFAAEDEPMNRINQAAESVGWQTQAHSADDAEAPDPHFESTTEVIEPVELDALTEVADIPEFESSAGDKRSSSYEFPFE